MHFTIETFEDILHVALNSEDWSLDQLYIMGISVGVSGVWFVLILSIVAKTGNSQLICQHCEQTSDPTGCTTFKRCHANQVCGVIRVDTGTSLFYNLTCVEKQTCDVYRVGSSFTKPSTLIPGPVGKREESDGLSFDNIRKRATVLTTACCTQTLCNNYIVPKGLDHRQNDTTPSRPACLVCDGYHAGPQFCTTHNMCQDTQVCKTGIVYVNGAIRYTYGCEERYICEAYVKNLNKSSIASGRREAGGLHICDACCYGDLCNQQDCFDLYKHMTLASLYPKPH